MTEYKISYSDIKLWKKYALDSIETKGIVKAHNLIFIYEMEVVVDMFLNTFNKARRTALRSPRLLFGSLST